jgi:DNA-binding MarR family transcriptional regulator
MVKIKVSDKRNTISTLEKIEEIFSLKGNLRVLYVLWDKKSLRYSEIQKETNLPAGTLNKALIFLIKKGFIKTHMKYIPSFRRHPISIYSLSNMGKNFCDEVFSDIKIENEKEKSSLNVEEYDYIKRKKLGENIL